MLEPGIVSPLGKPISLCEVAYSLQEDPWEDLYTPYRYKGVNSGYSVHSPEAYLPEYEQTTVGCRSPHSFATPALSPDHGYTLHVPGLDGTLIEEGGGLCPPVRRDRVKTAPCRQAVLPTLHAHRNRVSSAVGPGAPGRSEIFRTFHSQGHHGCPEGDERVTWMPSLNSWVSEKQNQNPVPYINFVNSLNLGDREFGEGLQAKLQQQRLRRDKRLSDMANHRSLSQNSQSQQKGSKHTGSQSDRSRGGYKSQSGKSSQAATYVPTDSGDGGSPSVGAGGDGDGTADRLNGARMMDDLESLGQGQDSVHSEPDASAKGIVSTPSTHSQASAHVHVTAPSVHVKESHTKLDKGGTNLPGLTHTSDRLSKCRTSKGKTVSIAKTSRKATGKSKGKKKNKGLAGVSNEGRNTHTLEADIDEENEDVVLESPDANQSKDDSNQSYQGQLTPSPENSSLSQKRQSKPKRIRWRAQRDCKKDEEAPQELPQWQRRTGNWLYDDEDFSGTLPETVETDEPEDKSDVIRTPSPKVLTPTPPSSAQGSRRSSRIPSAGQNIPDWAKKRWGQKQKDSDWEEEQRRRKLAQERRDKAQELYERLRQKRYQQVEESGTEGGPDFDEYGWLAKYCIFQQGHWDMYKHCFDVVDEDEKGYLTPVETMLALRAINNKISDTEEEYMYRVLEMTGYKITAGADIKLFAVIAALSQRITGLDEWMKHLIGDMDLKTLDRKLYMCKSLWECNVDPETNKISIDQLCVELRAGGVSLEHECEVRAKLGHLGALDLLDFLTYIPLFIMIHESVVENPLNDIRDK